MSKNVEQYLLNCQPKNVWQYFLQITTIPHGSKNEKQLCAYLVSFFKNHGIKDIYVDQYFNIIVHKPATKDCQHRKMFSFQAHLDMVNVKSPQSKHDFSKDPLDLQLSADQQWLSAKQTTLGADNGIGVAYIMDLMTNDSFSHGPLEAILTVDEEQDLTGAINLDKDHIKGDYLVNLDSEVQEVMTVGCCSSTMITLTKKICSDPNDQFDRLIEITLSGGKGGHSGIDIDKNRVNSIREMAFFLDHLFLNDIDLSLVKMDGGNFVNVIPNQCCAVIKIDAKKLLIFKKISDQYFTKNIDLYKKYEPNLQWNYRLDQKDPAQGFSIDDTKQIIHAIICLPNGNLNFDQANEIPLLSSNLGIVKTNQQGLELMIMPRSPWASRMEYVVGTSRVIAVNNGFTITYDPLTDGWINDDLNNVLIAASQETAMKTLGQRFIQKIIPAEVEIPKIVHKNPKMLAISIGPTMENVHSVNEKVNIRSVQKIYEFLIALISKDI